MRRLSPTEQAWAEWRLDGELNGGHTVSQTIGFVTDLEDVEDGVYRRGSRHPNVISAGPPESRFAAWFRRRRR